MTNSYHIVSPTADEEDLRQEVIAAARFRHKGLTLQTETGMELLRTLTKYRSELAELRGRQHPVPASTKAQEV